jgi:hypothetical protein
MRRYDLLWMLYMNVMFGMILGKTTKAQTVCLLHLSINNVLTKVLQNTFSSSNVDNEG